MEQSPKRSYFYNKIYFLLLFPLILFCAKSLNAQQVVHEWVGSFQGYYHEETSFTQNVDGDIISAGSYWSNPDFDPGDGFAHKVTEGLTDIFVLNWDSDRNFNWVTVLGGDGHDQAYDVITDADGNIYITGTFTETVDFDPGDSEFILEAVSGEDIFILKLNALGEFVWAQSFGSTGWDRGTGIALDETGYLFVCGGYFGTVDFDFGPGISEVTAVAGNDAFVLKMTLDGDLIWVKSFGAEDADYCSKIELDVTGGISLTGYFRGGSDFDPSDEVYELYIDDITTYTFASKLDFDGNFLWAQAIVSALGSLPVDLTTDEFGAVYVIGNFNDTIFFDYFGDVDTVTTVTTNTDAFIVKYDADGNYLWGETFGGTGSEAALAIQSDRAGFLYLAGAFNGTTDLDPGAGTAEHVSASSSDSYNLKLDIDGAYVWSDAIGSGGIDRAFDIYPDGEGNVLSIGTFMFDVDFDNSDDEAVIDLPGTERHLYIHKITECVPADSTDYITACNAYVWPETGFTYTNTNTYTLIYETAIGCDSMRTLDLLINEISNGVNIEELSLVAEQDDATYQWIDCDNDYAILEGENDQVFNPTVNGNYAVVVTTDAGCIDTSVCIVVNYMNLNSYVTPFVRIYPNPASDLLFVKSNVTLSGTYAIYNAMGEILRQSKLSTDQQISISELEAGIYFIRFENGATALFSKK